VKACRPFFVRLALAAVTWLAISAPAPADGPIVLRDVTRETGIDFRHTDGSSGRRYIVEYVASGLATFDYDNDGLIDIYFLNGRPLPGAKPDPSVKNRLYRNRGGFRFEDVTKKAGIGDAGFGLGVCVGDYDNDGHPDIYVSNFGPNVLYRNNGDGTFTDVTARAGVGRGRKVGAGASFLDIDGDGNLDLFAANYIKFSFESSKPHYLMGIPTYSSPLDFPRDTNNLFRNNGDGTFSDVSVESGIAAHPGAGMGIVCADFDNRGSTDIFVANDTMGNFLFRNDGHGKFEESAVIAGVAFEAGGVPHGNMGADCADLSHNARLDLFVTAYHREWAVLYRNLGNGMFDDVTRVAGAGQGSFAHVKWGCGLVDFDNDGYRDIFLVCGHFDENVRLRDDTTSYMVRPILLRNTGQGKFVNVSDASGDGMRAELTGRGVAFDDLDNDGRIDVVILNSRRGPTILRNETATGNHWLQLQLHGVKTNRDGVGARVRVIAGGLAQIDEVHSGRGYQSHFGSRLHFGLGTRNRADRVEVRWLGGGVDVWENLAVDRLMTLTEGAAAARP